jgi:acyl-coenzyme A thioesterase 9
VFPGVHRTGITAKLWQNRMQFKGEHPKYEETSDLPFLVKKTPSESREEISVRKQFQNFANQLQMPFSSDLHLRDQYISPFGHLRMGKLLEDLDAMAGNVAFK